MPGSVEDLTLTFDAVYNSTANTLSLNASISWSEPLQPNGEVEAYTYSIEDTSGAVVSAPSNTSVVAVVVLGVEAAPYVELTAMVFAYTEAGPGNDSTVTMFTPQAGQWYTVYLHRILYSQEVVLFAYTSHSKCVLVPFLLLHSH